MEGGIFLKSADEGKIMGRSAWPQGPARVHHAHCPVWLRCAVSLFNRAYMARDAAAGLVGSKLTDRHGDRGAPAVEARG